MNFTYVLGFVVLRDVVKVFPVSSPSFARMTTRKNRARSHSEHDAARWQSGISNWLRDHSCQSCPGAVGHDRTSRSIASRVLRVGHGQLLHLRKGRSFPPCRVGSQGSSTEKPRLAVDLLRNLDWLSIYRGTSTACLSTEEPRLTVDLHVLRDLDLDENVLEHLDVADCCWKTVEFRTSHFVWTIGHDGAVLCSQLRERHTGQ